MLSLFCRLLFLSWRQRHHPHHGQLLSDDDDVDVCGCRHIVGSFLPSANWLDLGFCILPVVLPFEPPHHHLSVAVPGALLASSALPVFPVISRFYSPWRESVNASMRIFPGAVSPLSLNQGATEPPMQPKEAT